MATETGLGAPSSLTGPLTSLEDSSAPVEAAYEATVDVLGRIELQAAAAVPMTVTETGNQLEWGVGPTVTIAAAEVLSPRPLEGISTHDLRPDAAGPRGLISTDCKPTPCEPNIAPSFPFPPVLSRPRPNWLA